MISGLASAIPGGGIPNDLVVGLYNALVLRSWYKGMMCLPLLFIAILCN